MTQLTQVAQPKLPPGHELSPRSVTGLPTRFGRKPALDGIRAIAVGSVIAYHFGSQQMNGGFLGVDMFFVLSGYLITSLLLVEWGRRSRIDLGAFWAGRARRLLPALIVALLAVAAWSYFYADPIRLDAIRQDGIWSLFSGVNWHFIVSGQSYFDVFSEASPLRHLWFLAIEVQFLLAWPLAVIALLHLGRGRTRFLTVFSLAGVIASSTLMVNLYRAGDPSRAYYGTDTRAGQLLIGALLAILLARWSPTTRASQRGLQSLGVAGIVLAVATFVVATDQDTWLYHGGFLAFAVATALLIAAAVQPGHHVLGATLSLRPLRWVGKISYGLYLWHWPISIFLSESRIGISGWSLAFLRLGVTFAVAALSYYRLELPIRNSHWLSGRSGAILAPAAIGFTLLMILASTAGAVPPPAFLTARPNQVLNTPKNTKGPTLPTNAPRMLLLGDSVAASIGDALQAEAASREIVLTAATRPGCGMVTGIPANADGSEVPWGRTCADGTLPYLSDQATSSGAQVVLWLSTWETSDRIINGRLVKFGTPAADRALLAKLQESYATITA
ncbi:MAG TPA: acyltransferase family protein, partial [Acidimicrobiia bacterium]|nr:acyltransferase family protein [Acidimicrobiia bacterium]